MDGLLTLIISGLNKELVQEFAEPKAPATGLPKRSRYKTFETAKTQARHQI